MPESVEEPLNVAYLTSKYPRAVDSSIRNEIIQLRELGHVVHTFSIRKAADAELLTDFHRREREATVYVLSDHAAVLPFAALRALLRWPRRFGAALALALRTAPAGIKGLVWQLAYLCEAAFLAHRLVELDVEHLHVHIGESSASVAMLASAISGVPYSMTIHGPYIFRAPERWALGEKIKRSKFTACITDFARSQCMIYVPHDCWDKLRIVRVGLDANFLETQPSPMSENPRFIWVGRFCEEKAVPVVLDAACLLAEEGVDFELLMVGDGPLRREAQDRVERLGLHERIRFPGWIAPSDLVKAVKDSQVLLIPSFAEGLPAVIFEALAMQRPVISTYIAGIPELVVPGRNGWLVAAGSVEQLADAMREALATPAARLEEMGEAGRQAVMERHHPRVEAARLASIIRE